MAKKKPKPALKKSHLQDNMIAGVLAIIPIAVTYWVVDFLVGILIYVGTPGARALARAFRPELPVVSDVLLNPTVQSVIAVVLVLVAIFFLGALARNVVGNRVIKFFERIIERLPLVSTLYGSIRKLLDALTNRPDGSQQIVLIDFPSPEMKTIGIVTRTMKDMDTGEDLAAVFVPTTPNPTNGYLEVVPISKLTMTDWDIDDAMNFVVSGGAVGPEAMHYSKSAPNAAKLEDVVPDLTNTSPDDAR